MRRVDMSLRRTGLASGMCKASPGFPRKADSVHYSTGNARRMKGRRGPYSPAVTGARPGRKSKSIAFSPPVSVTVPE